MTPVDQHLLLVENAGVAQTLEPLLIEYGWTVRSCTSTREAIYAAKQQQVDALIVTVRLPDERGDVAFYRIAAQYPHLRTRTLFLVETEEEQTLVKTIGVESVMLPSTPETILQRFEER